MLGPKSRKHIGITYILGLRTRLLAANDWRPATRAKARLVDPDQNRRANPRLGNVQSNHRQQIARLLRGQSQGRGCRSEWVRSRSYDSPTEEDGTACQVRISLTEQTRQAVDDCVKAAGKRPGQFLFSGRRGSERRMSTRQYASLVSEWIASVGLDAHFFGIASASVATNILMGHLPSCESMNSAKAAQAKGEPPRRGPQCRWRDGLAN